MKRIVLLVALLNIFVCSHAQYNQKHAEKVMTQKLEAELKRREQLKKQAEEKAKREAERQQQINETIQRNQQATQQLEQIHAEQFMTGMPTVKEVKNDTLTSTSNEEQQEALWRAEQRAETMKNGQISKYNNGYVSPEKNILPQNRTPHYPWNPKVTTFKPPVRQKLPQVKRPNENVGKGQRQMGNSQGQKRQIAPQLYRAQYSNAKVVKVSPIQMRQTNSSYPPPPPSQIPAGGFVPGRLPGNTYSEDFKPVKVPTREERQRQQMLKELFPEKKRDARYEEWLRQHETVQSTLPLCNFTTKQCWVAKNTSSNGWTRKR